MYAELTIDQGATFESSIDLTNDDGTPVDLTNNTFVCQIRKSFYSANVTANVDIVVPNPTTGTIKLSIDAANTANIKPGRYLYDLKMTSNITNTTSRVLEGIVTITPQVSR